MAEEGGGAIAKVATSSKPATGGGRGTRSQEREPEHLYYGGIVSIPGPFGLNDDRKVAEGSAALERSIKAGVLALRDGTSEFVDGAELDPNAELEILDLFDVATGHHHRVWRVPCREREAPGV